MQKTIQNETVLMPYIIAEGVIREAFAANLSDLTESKASILENYLVGRADTLFIHSAHFKKQITAAGNKGRDNLYMFMRHWLEAELKRK